MIVTIDGPAGAGKSTVAKLLAGKLNYEFLDTGAMYRALAFVATDNNYTIKEINKIVALAKNLKIRFDKKGDKTLIKVNDYGNVSSFIRTTAITKLASQIASFKEIKLVMYELQRKFAFDKDVVTEGRDQGSSVFPDADFKFYLDASIDERAKRRHKELIQQGEDVSLKSLRIQIEERDKDDMNKEFGALTMPKDGIIIDTSCLNIKEVVNKLYEIVAGKLNRGL